MTKREQDLLKRIDALERKVKELEARPATQWHYHYQYPQPYYIPTYVPSPSPWWTSPITWGAGSAAGAGQATTTQVTWDPNTPFAYTSIS